VYEGIFVVVRATPPSDCTRKVTSSASCWLIVVNCVVPVFEMYPSVSIKPWRTFRRVSMSLWRYVVGTNFVSAVCPCMPSCRVCGSRPVNPYAYFDDSLLMV